MKPYTYLVIDFVAIIVCLIYSFDKRILFYKHFGAYLKAATLVAIPFILWDIWFTKMGVWWFNYNYTMGIKFIGLPLEEYLFFLCIPFSCVFTYFCLDKFFNLDWANKYGKPVSWFVMVVSLVVTVIFYDRLYPVVTAVAAILTMVYLNYVARVDWIGKASLVYCILIPGFLLVNGVLTGTGLESPIVNYKPSEILNVRLLSIPVEDSFFGYTQFLLVTYLFLLFKEGRFKKLNIGSPHPGVG